MHKSLIGLGAVLLSLGSLGQAGPTEIRIGTLAYGTVNWELDTIRQYRLVDPQTLQLTIQNFANPEAAKIAFQSGTVDLIVSDWVWTAVQREVGRDFTFIPYSTTAGALVVPQDSPIRELRDLAGHRLGVAGGGLDKNWLFLRAVVEKEHGIDLQGSAEISFGAPPLLNQQMEQGRLDALLTYWHYAARLEAKGYRRLLDGNRLLARLGHAAVPSLGWVFRESWARAQESALTAFVPATRQAQSRLCRNDEAWQAIAPLVRAPDPATDKLLRKRYCEGLILRFGDTERNAAAGIYRLLHRLDPGAAGRSGRLPEGVFWPTAYPFSMHPASTN